VSAYLRTYATQIAYLGRSKHIEIRFKFVAQTIAENIGRVRAAVRYTTTEINLADILTHCPKQRSSG